MDKQWYFALHDDPQFMANKGYRNVEGLSLEEALTFFDYTVRREIDSNSEIHPVIGCVIKAGIKDDLSNEDKIYIPLKTIDDPEYQDGLKWAEELDECGWELLNNEVFKKSQIEYSNYLKEEQMMFMRVGRRI